MVIEQWHNILDIFKNHCTLKMINFMLCMFHHKDKEIGKKEGRRQGRKEGRKEGRERKGERGPEWSSNLARVAELAAPELGFGEPLTPCSRAPALVHHVLLQVAEVSQLHPQKPSITDEFRILKGAYKNRRHRDSQGCL